MTVSLVALLSLWNRLPRVALSPLSGTSLVHRTVFPSKQNIKSVWYLSRNKVAYLLWGTLCLSDATWSCLSGIHSCPKWGSGFFTCFSLDSARHLVESCRWSISQWRPLHLSEIHIAARKPQRKVCIFHFDLWRPQLYSFFCFFLPWGSLWAASTTLRLTESYSSKWRCWGGLWTSECHSWERMGQERGLKEWDWMNHLEGESCRENRRFILKEFSQQSLFL